MKCWYPKEIIQVCEERWLGKLKKRRDEFREEKMKQDEKENTKRLKRWRFIIKRKRIRIKIDMGMRVREVGNRIRKVGIRNENNEKKIKN